jgi:hypothetical protein
MKAMLSYVMAVVSVATTSYAKDASCLAWCCDETSNYVCCDGVDGKHRAPGWVELGNVSEACRNECANAGGQKEVVTCIEACKAEGR